MICFFFKQKSAYELRISGWSSGVCASDLQCIEHDVRFVDGKLLLRLSGEQDRQAESRRGGSESCRNGHCGSLELDQGICAMRVGRDEMGRAYCRDRVCQCG